MDLKLKKLISKTVIFILSLSFAWWLIRSGYLQNLIDTILPLRFVSEFMAGVLYASFLTSPVSVAMLVVLARDNNPIVTALLAGAGAVLADIVILKFFRKELSSDLNLVSRELQFKKVSHFLQRLHLDFTVPLIGAVIVASPLPDELGLVMMGASRLSYQQIAIISYILNTAGILLLVIPFNLIS